MRLFVGNKWRWLAVVVMAWSGWLTTVFAFWMMAIPPDLMGMHHAAAITGFTGGIAAVFKFAFNFAVTGITSSGGNG